jgi:hypothetical protein
MLSISTGSIRINICAAGAEKIMKYKLSVLTILLVGMAASAHAVDVGDIVGNSLLIKHCDSD